MTGLTVPDLAGAEGARSGAGAQGAALAGGAAPAAASPAQTYANPTLRLDSALGLVVIEFRDAGGAVTRSIPSAHELNAYRLWTETGQGRNPLLPPPGAAIKPDGP